MTKSNDIKVIILKKLYEAYFDGSDTYSLNSLINEKKLDIEIYWQIVKELENEELIEIKYSDRHYQITCEGIIYCEENEVIQLSAIKENARIRTEILAGLKNFHERTSYNDLVEYRYLLQQIKLDSQNAHQNLFFLREIGYLDIIGRNQLTLTTFGKEKLEEVEQKNKMIRDFNNLTDFKPQARGRAFQKHMAEYLEQQGWRSEEGVRNPNEEMDVILCKEREYILIECKWEKDPIGSAVIRELSGKLYSRGGIIGVLMSMSGITGNVEMTIREYLDKNAILVFGSQDITDLLTYKKDFDELLNEKHRALMTRKKVDWQ